MGAERNHVLLVEDDDQLSELLLEYLGMHGLELERVASGDAGADRILEAQPDLVILDLMLPGLNGLDVCRRVRDSYMGAIVMQPDKGGDSGRASLLVRGVKVNEWSSACCSRSQRDRRQADDDDGEQQGQQRRRQGVGRAADHGAGAQQQPPAHRSRPAGRSAAERTG
jgi:chemotaxis response regulator CheB